MTGREHPHVNSRFLLMGMKGTFFSQEYLKKSFFSENTRVGLMKSPSIVVVYNTLDLRSEPTQDYNM